MEKIFQKVTAFITRTFPDGAYLLLFEHPHGGIQIPAGTAEEGESPETAARREATEESGLKSLTLRAKLASVTESIPDNWRYVPITTPVYVRPNLKSARWATLRNGIVVEIQRQEGGFTQVKYSEPEKIDNPSAISYQVIGWVPKENLVDTRVRHFYHFEYSGEQVDPWWVEADYHRLRLFWTPLNALPRIAKPQDEWVKVLVKSLDKGSGESF